MNTFEFQLINSQLDVITSRKIVPENQVLFLMICTLRNEYTIRGRLDGEQMVR